MATRNIIDFKYMTERKCAYDERSTFESIQFVLIKQARGTGGIQPRNNIRIDSVFDSVSNTNFEMIERRNKNSH